MLYISGGVLHNAIEFYLPFLFNSTNRTLLLSLFGLL